MVKWKHCSGLKKQCLRTEEPLGLLWVFSKGTDVQTTLTATRISQCPWESGQNSKKCSLNEYNSDWLIAQQTRKLLPYRLGQFYSSTWCVLLKFLCSLPVEWSFKEIDFWNHKFLSNWSSILTIDSSGHLFWSLNLDLSQPSLSLRYIHTTHLPCRHSTHL